jgi:adenylate kinase
MNKTQKLEYQLQIEKYFEENQVYDLFESLMKSLLKEKPKSPIDFLISKLENPERKAILDNVLAKRIFIMGPPGCRKKEKALTLAEEFQCNTVSVGDLLQKEVNKKSELGKKIEESKSRYAYGNASNYSLVEDDLVIELVNQQLKESEKEGKSYIIEGYPRTRVQAIALQSKGIIPDKFFILNMSEETIRQKVITGLQAADPQKPETKAIVDNIILEYNMYTSSI